MSRWFLVVLLNAILVSANAFAQPIPPKAAMVPFVDDFHKDPRTDNYRWMHERESSEVLKHLEAENAYGDEVVAKYDYLKKPLYQELKALRETSAKQIVTATSNYVYYKTKNAQQSYWVWFRTSKKTGQTVKILDENQLATDNNYTYVQVWKIQLSPKEEKVFFVADLKGRRHITPLILDLKTMKLQKIEVDLMWDLFASVVWLNEEEVLFTGTSDELGVYQLYKFNITTQKTTLIKEFDDKDSRRQPFVTADGKFIVVALTKSKSTKSYLFDRQTEALSEIDPLDAGEFIETMNHNQYGWIKLTNRHSENFQILLKVNGVWELLYAPAKGMIKEFTLTNEAVIVKEVNEASESIVIVDIKSKSIQVVPSSQKLISYSSMKADFNGEKIYLERSSYVMPKETISCDLSNCQPKVEVPGSIVGFDPSLYETKLIQVKARDGELVPASIYYRKDKFTGNNQFVHLYGYGSYGSSSMPMFDKSRIPLLNRGVIGVVAHIRGGREKGERWYDQGRYFNKMNTFNDFIDVADELVHSGLTSPSKIAIEGASAGGLLLGSVLNMRPDLFRVALMKVPFVDVLNTMTLYYDPLAKYEKKEWGDGLIENEYYLIKSYDPYTNISKQNYPSVFLTTGFEDTAVYYFQPMKWVAKMREINAPDEKNPVVFFTSFGAGHGIPGDEANDQALSKEFSFVLGELGF